MKNRETVRGRSPFWSRILGLLIAFAIIAVLGFGGVRSLTGELSEAYDALAASQYELGMTRNELATSQNDLARAHGEINSMHNKLVAKSHMLRQGAHTLKVSRNQINRLIADRDDLRRDLGQAASALAESNLLQKQTELARRDAETALDQYQQQPKLSMVVTTERMFTMSQRERFAASQTRMFAEGDGGVVFYEGQEMLHEFEQRMLYAERTQTVLTQTAPGRDVLECLNAADGCGTIMAAQFSAQRMEAYAYQSQYSSAEMLLTDGRRGRRPGRRR